MKDINNLEVDVGDRILVAFTRYGKARLKYARVLEVGKYMAKIRFENPGSGYKNKTIHYSTSAILKVGEDDRL